MPHLRTADIYKQYITVVLVLTSVGLLIIICHFEITLSRLDSDMQPLVFSHGLESHRIDDSKDDLSLDLRNEIYLSLPNVTRDLMDHESNQTYHIAMASCENAPLRSS